jgi:hypothetical protein
LKLSATFVLTFDGKLNVKLLFDIFQKFAGAAAGGRQIGLQS